MSFSSVTAFFDHSVSLQVTWLILHFLWQGLVVAAGVFVVNALLARSSPRWRHGVALSGLLGMIACVGLTWTLLGRADSVHSTPAGQGPIAVGAPLVIPAELAVEIQAAPTPPKSALETWAPAATAVYALGVALMLLRLCVSAVGIGRFRRGSRRASADLVKRAGVLAERVRLRAAPTLETCSRILVPVVVGVIKPVILLPPTALGGMTAAEVDAILLHELSHVRRGDLLVNLLQRLVEAVLFFHPAVWYVSHVLTAERENCCDDAVLQHSDQEVYARALIRLAETRSGKQAAAPLAALAASGASPSQLKRRVMRILGVEARRPLHRPSLLVVVACVCALAMSAVQLQAQANREDGGEDPVAGEASPSRSLTTTLSENGRVVEIRTGADDFGRLTSILQQLSALPRVTITSSSITRDGDRLKMVVKGENLDYRSMASATRQVDGPRALALLREEEHKQDAPREALQGEATDALLLRGGVLDSVSSQEVVKALQVIWGEGTEGKRVGPKGIGRVEIESVGDAMMLRGKAPDLERIINIIRQIERLEGELKKAAADKSPLQAKLQQLVQQDQELSTRYGEAHPKRLAIGRQIVALRSQIGKLLTSQSHGKTDEAVNGQAATDLGPVALEFLEGSNVVVARGEKEDVERVKAMLGKLEREANKPRGQQPNPQPTSASKTTGPVRFEIFAGDRFVIRGKKADVERVMQFLERTRGKDWPKSARPSDLEHSDSLLTDPVRIEFIEGTDIFIVRGKKEDVKRVTGVLDGPAVGKPQQPVQQPASNEGVFQLYQLKHSIATEVAKTLHEVFRDLITGKGKQGVTIEADSESNRIFVRAPQHLQRKVMQLLAELDTAPRAQHTFTSYRLRHVDAADAAILLKQQLVPGKTKSVLSIAVDGRTNSLVVRAEPTAHKKILTLLGKIDVEAKKPRKQEDGAAKTLVSYKLKHTAARDALRLLKAHFADADEPPKMLAQDNLVIAYASAATHKAIATLLREHDAKQRPQEEE